MRILALVSLAAAACGGRVHPAPVTANAAGPGGIAAAALPYAIVDGHTGRAVATDAFWTAVAAARGVCVGEEHPNPHHHWAQLAIVQHLATAGGRRALGLEMLQQPVQGVVDDFAAGAIDEATFRSRVGWEDRWGYPYELYGPTIAAAIGAGWAVRALNAPSELVKRVSKVGVAGLEPAERERLPELVLDDAKHRAWFDALMADMGAHGEGHGAHGSDHGGAAMPSPDNLYAAQVVWDESMAAGAKAFLDGGDAIVILAGNGHCHDWGVAGRLRRRGVTPVVSVRPIIDDGHGNVAEALTEGNADYLWIMTMPAGAAPAAE